MKKILLLAALSLVAFTSNSCTGSGDELSSINRITLEVDGLTKRFDYVTVDATGTDAIKIHGQIGGSLVETIDIEMYKNATGTSAIYNMVFTQNDVEYYGYDGGGVNSNVSANGTDRKLKGTFSGAFRTISNTTKIINNGSLTVSY